MTDAELANLEFLYERLGAKASPALRLVASLRESRARVAELEAAIERVRVTSEMLFDALRYSTPPEATE